MRRRHPNRMTLLQLLQYCKLSSVSRPHIRALVILKETLQVLHLVIQRSRAIYLLGISSLHEQRAHSAINS